MGPRRNPTLVQRIPLDLMMPSALAAHVQQQMKPSAATRNAQTRKKASKSTAALARNPTSAQKAKLWPPKECAREIAAATMLQPVARNRISLRPQMLTLVG